MYGTLLRGRASILRYSAECSAFVLRPMRASPPPPSSAICTVLRASASVLCHSAPTTPRFLTFTFCLSCLERRADSLHNLLLTKLHQSIKFVHSFTCSLNLVTCSLSCCAPSAKRKPPKEPSHHSCSEICILIVYHMLQPLLAPLTILPISISSKGYERSPFAFRHANGWLLLPQTL